MIHLSDATLIGKWDFVLLNSTELLCVAEFKEDSI